MKQKGDMKAEVLALIVLLIIPAALAITVPSGYPINAVIDTVRHIKDTPHSGTKEYGGSVKFTEGHKITTREIAFGAGLPEDSVKFCINEFEPECPAEVVFSDEYFNASEDEIEAKDKVYGNIWVYNDGEKYWIGFVEDQEKMNPPLQSTLPNILNALIVLFILFPVIIMWLIAALIYLFSKKPAEQKRTELIKHIKISVLAQIIWSIIWSLILIIFGLN